MDRVSVATGLVAAAAVVLPFVSLRANRLTTGAPLLLWQALGRDHTVILGLLLAAVGVLCVHGRRGVASAIASMMVGGALSVAAVFLAAGAAASLSQAPNSRVSLAAGAWLLVLAGYLLAASGSDRISPLWRSVLALAPLVALAALLAVGSLDALSLVKEFQARRSRVGQEILAHLSIAGSAVTAAVVVGIPLGIWAFRRQVAERVIFFGVNTIQTIPSLALFGLMIAPLAALTQRLPGLRRLGVQGIGAAPALIALALYALLPITRNTYASLAMLDRAMLDAGRGMGMSRLQLLRRVEIPLALPVILGGIRTSLVQAVGNTTVAALIGAGGLGVFVFQGLGQAVPDLILLGAVPVVLLALVVDRLMAGLARTVTPRGLTR